MRAYSSLSSRPHLGLDHVRGLLADHDGRRIGIAADQGRHDRGVDDAQAFRSVHFQLRIDYCDGIVDAYFAGADRVIDGVDARAAGCGYRRRCARLR